MLYQKLRVLSKNFAMRASALPSTSRLGCELGTLSKRLQGRHHRQNLSYVHASIPQCGKRAINTDLQLQGLNGAIQRSHFRCRTAEPLGVSFLSQEWNRHQSTFQKRLKYVRASSGGVDGEAPGVFVDGVLDRESAPENDVSNGVGDLQPSSELIFVGTGTSEGIPRVSCLTDPTKKCEVCWAATQPGSRNRRRNTSLLVRYAHPDGRLRNLLVDAGKFFYHSALQWFPQYRIRHLDAVIITHSHADAIGGLDDLRDWTNNVQDQIPIYVAPRDLAVMAKTHYYLVDSSRITPGTAVSDISFREFHPAAPFQVHGLQVLPLPVWHGKGYKSLGFRFGNICYISDVSEIPEETFHLLRDCDILILDALRPDRSSATHFGLPEALKNVRKIAPKRTLFTGMMHTMHHEQVSAELAGLLQSEGLHVALSYDGLRVPVDLSVCSLNLGSVSVA